MPLVSCHLFQTLPSFYYYPKLCVTKPLTKVSKSREQPKKILIIKIMLLFLEGCLLMLLPYNMLPVGPFGHLFTIACFPRPPYLTRDRAWLGAMEVAGTVYCSKQEIREPRLKCKSGKKKSNHRCMSSASRLLCDLVLFPHSGLAEITSWS